MARDTDIGQATTTDLSGTIQDFSVPSETTDAEGDQKETVWDYPNANNDLGYYKNIPEFKGAIDALAIWTCGIGWDTETTRQQIILENITGWGEDSFQSICNNLITMKKALGDSFAEIVRSDEGTLINLKPLYTGDMRVVVNQEGIIDHYEHKIKGTKDGFKKLQPDKVLHLVNDRIANEIHGTPASAAIKFIIDAKQEAMKDWRRIAHRSSIRVLYVDIDDTTRLNTLKTEYSTGLKNGDVMLIPAKKGEAEFQDLDLPPIDAFIRWLQYLDNLFYQTVGVPKIIATSEGFTEAGGTIGFITFEPIYTAEQALLEADLWNQVAIRVKFKRPPSLSNITKENQEKNTGQTTIQPNELNAEVQTNEKASA